MLDFEARVRTLPQVTSVASVSGRPMSPGSTGMGIVAGERPDESRDIPWASWRRITGDYFRTMGVSLLKGLTFGEQDLIARPWRIIVSQRLADLLWPGEDPVGRQAILWKGQGNQKAEVIGVVGNMRERGLSQPPTLAVYLPAYGAGRSHVLCDSHHGTHRDDRADAAHDARRHRSGASARQRPDARRDRVGVDCVEAVHGRPAERICGDRADAGARRDLRRDLVCRVATDRGIGVRLALGASHDRVFRFVIVQGMKPVVVSIAFAPSPRCSCRTWSRIFSSA